MTFLHITNGDGAANTIKRSAVPGDVLPWRDPMHHGPFQAGKSLDELSEIRARYLAGPGVDAAEAERGFRLRDEHLRAAPRYGTVVLWFEHDLLDQLQILQLLDWFAEADIGDAALEMICIDRFPGVEPFRGLGQLDAKQIASLIEMRRPVSAAAIALARRGWAAFRSEDPNDLLAFLREESGGLPFLGAALRRHLEEYPSARSGLSRTEHQLLYLVSEGRAGPVELFVGNMDLETVLFIGDWPTFSTIERLCRCLLLTCAPEPFWYPPASQAERQAFRDQRLTLTEEGAAVLRGERDAFDLVPRDQWLGGVHLRSEQPMWTWEAAETRLVLRDP